MSVFLGAVDSESKPKKGEEVYARWNDTNRWTTGIFKGETKNGFEVYDHSIIKPNHIEYYAQISRLPYPHGNKKTFKSKKWSDRNYKNYNFK